MIARIHPTLGIVVSTWCGRVADAEILPSYQALYQDPEWKPGMSELVDLREADLSDVSGAGLRALVEMTASYLQDFGGEAKTAAVASQDSVFGMGRMYEALSAESPEMAQMFRDAREALAWLGAPRDLLD